MRLVIAIGLGALSLFAQNCAPTGVLPVGSFAGGFLDHTSCLLSDGTAYAAYQLVLPVRGQLQISLTQVGANIGLIVRDGTGAQIASGTIVQRAVEAGSYTILVNGPASSASAAYTLLTAFTAEPGMLCSGFPSIGLNQMVAGALGSSGCAAPDGSAYEAYSLTTFGSGSLTVTASSAAFTAALTVRGSDGSALASGPSPLTVPVAGGSQYQIVVSATGQTGAYQITTSFQPADMETCVSRKSFTNPDSDSGTIAFNSCSIVSSDSGAQSFFNYYNLTVAAGGLADIVASSPDFHPTLYLLDAGGNQLAVDAGGGSNGQSEIRTQLSPGNYVIQIFSDIASGGSYKLTYGIAPGDPQACPLVTASLGGTLGGVLSSSSCRSSVGLADIYTLTLPVSGTLGINLTSGSFSSLAAIRDAKDNLVVANRDVQGLGISQITADLPAGTYTVAAAAGSGSGAYQLVSTFSPDTIPACAQAQPINVGGGFIQLLGSSSCRAANGQPQDLYQFTLPADATVAAVMLSSEFDAYLTLSDSAGNVLRADDNSYGSNDPFIVQFLRAGTYTLAARAASSTSGGVYQISVLSAPGARPQFCAGKGTLAIDGKISGSIGITGCQYVDGTFADIYEIDLANSAQIDLRLNSASFDAYLVLLDAKGNLVDQDDDDGGGTNARIIHQLNAGTYYVAAKPFSDYFAGGNYTLTLAATQQ